MTSEMPNSPIATTTRETPSRNSWMPPVNRVSPEFTSTPMVPSRMPRQTIISPRVAPEVLTTEAATRPSTITEKYSAGWNSRANSASRGDSSTMTTTPNRAPNIDAIAVENSAMPARPCCAIG